MFFHARRQFPAMKRKLDFISKHHNFQLPLPKYARSICTMAPSSIQLTERESRLRLLLLDVAKHISENAQPPLQEPVAVRWAGGWVRDKLLDIESHDIDVAINNMTGEHFAQQMSNFCENPDAIKQHAIGEKDIGNLHKVAKNPDKSKHLETAMVPIFGLDLDFVNLRKETYADDSRNPQMEFGTAEEDAMRRDATINALFYNLHTGEVEDFTQGLSDMEAKLIRTPLDPLQTFTDDPLRVLRLVRFASRLLFTIDPLTRSYMNEPSVLDALKVKISRERVGIELEKMLRGKHPGKSLQLIDELKLYHAIFTDPSKSSCPQPEISKWAVACTCLEDLLTSRTKSIASYLVTTDEAAYMAWNLAALAPWMVADDPPHLRRKPTSFPLVAWVSREGFKAPNKLSDVIAASYHHRQEILGFKNDISSGKSFMHERDIIGMAIRKWESQGGSWKLQVLNALLVEAMEMVQQWDTDGM